MKFTIWSITCLNLILKAHSLFNGYLINIYMTYKITRVVLIIRVSIPFILIYFFSFFFYFLFFIFVLKKDYISLLFNCYIFYSIVQCSYSRWTMPLIYIYLNESNSHKFGLVRFKLVNNIHIGVILDIISMSLLYPFNNYVTFKITI